MLFRTCSCSSPFAALWAQHCKGICMSRCSNRQSQLGEDRVLRTRISKLSLNTDVLFSCNAAFTEDRQHQHMTGVACMTQSVMPSRIGLPNCCLRNAAIAFQLT